MGFDQTSHCSAMWFGTQYQVRPLAPSSTSALGVRLQKTSCNDLPVRKDCACCAALLFELGHHNLQRARGCMGSVTAAR